MWAVRFIMHGCPGLSFPTVELMNRVSAAIVIIVAMSCGAFGQTPSSTSCMIRGAVTRVDGTPVSGVWVQLIQREPGALIFPKAQDLLVAQETNIRGEFILRTTKWKENASQQLIAGGTTAQKPRIRGEIVDRNYVLISNPSTDRPNIILVPNDFIASRHDPRKGLLDPRLLKSH
jgi:hypothetical protein